jgi:hypothetical protein
VRATRWRGVHTADAAVETHAIGVLWQLGHIMQHRKHMLLLLHQMPSPLPPVAAALASTACAAATASAAEDSPCCWPLSRCFAAWLAGVQLQPSNRLLCCCQHDERLLYICSDITSCQLLTLF